MTDPELLGLLLDRKRLERELAAVLRRVGPSEPNRVRVNKQRAVDRKKLRKALRRNSDAIAARCVTLFFPTH